MKELTGYIPDFGFDLYDLTCLTDDGIKGTVMDRVVMFLKSCC